MKTVSKNLADYFEATFVTDDQQIAGWQCKTCPKVFALESKDAGKRSRMLQHALEHGGVQLALVVKK